MNYYIVKPSYKAKLRLGSELSKGNSSRLNLHSFQSVYLSKMIISDSHLSHKIIDDWEVPDLCQLPCNLQNWSQCWGLCGLESHQYFCLTVATKDVF